MAYVVSQRVQIEWVKLLSFSANQKAGLLEGPPPTLSLRSTTSQQLDGKNKQVRVAARFECIGTTDSQKSVPLLHIEAIYELVYSIPSTEGIEDRNIVAFGELNGLYNGWPYWRELVQSTLGRMGLPPFTLPVYRPANDEQARPALPSDSRSGVTRLEEKGAGRQKPAKVKQKKS
ncbi:hypothetical protein [Caulifigura coniformis]|uniref:hypothetical protein n=1 Tax=Caulifigura coniformis TaxID=2527983 RepID=UPI00119D3344|nr:hypothetical protein [Caulifigura coniformis]